MHSGKFVLSFSFSLFTSYLVGRLWKRVIWSKGWGGVWKFGGVGSDNQC